MSPSPSQPTHLPKGCPSRSTGSSKTQPHEETETGDSPALLFPTGIEGGPHYIIPVAKYPDSGTLFHSFLPAAPRWPSLQQPRWRGGSWTGPAGRSSPTAHVCLGAAGMRLRCTQDPRPALAGASARPWLESLKQSAPEAGTAAHRPAHGFDLCSLLPSARQQCRPNTAWLRPRPAQGCWAISRHRGAARSRILCVGRATPPRTCSPGSGAWVLKGPPKRGHVLPGSQKIAGFEEEARGRLPRGTSTRLRR
jgi:hypothetical protein